MALRRGLIAASTGLLLVSLLLAFCAAVNIGMSEANQRATPRWCTGNLALLTFSVCAIAWAITFLTLRWPWAARLLAAAVALCIGGYAGFMGLFWAFFAG
jgi:hypothetical protein